VGCFAPHGKGYPTGMTETEKNETTSPPDDTHEATTPPGNPDTDSEALDRDEEKLDQAGGGH